MFKLIHDDANFIVIDKAPGVHFHSQDGSAGVVASAEAALGLKLYAVHRLDTLTSGLIILAKSSAAAADFTELFSNHRVQKYYLALAKGKPKKKQGKIAGDMAKSRRSQYKLLRTMDNPAVTQFFSASVDEGLRAYLLKPLSGKTHQLRVALASLGTPILGDELYGGELSDRGYLHAWQLQFEFRGQSYQFGSAPEFGSLFQLPALTMLLNGEWLSPATLDWPKP
ncbi:TIGR01621 family pseudouridine synthase [Shewanella sp. JM162201]|uniref:TIGR01621 family pseudouridine synthase n=1 Tax=Shewanella jiangmenensis TaxID=2837387 RepID=A0ABS5V3W8_9GAMM|nr:TIGR01621 family pseudouridine synthase [Shewanella jiangmenensis]MBT1445149.1 TIGR01621 family pseudouridine synthase [Shewanella jiangmenensis]